MVPKRSVNALRLPAPSPPASFWTVSANKEHRILMGPSCHRQWARTCHSNEEDGRRRCRFHRSKDKPPPHRSRTVGASGPRQPENTSATSSATGPRERANSSGPKNCESIAGAGRAAEERKRTTEEGAASRSSRTSDFFLATATASDQETENTDGVAFSLAFADPKNKTPLFFILDVPFASAIGPREQEPIAGPSGWRKWKPTAGTDRDAEARQRASEEGAAPNGKKTRAFAISFPTADPKNKTPLFFILDVPIASAIGPREQEPIAGPSGWRKWEPTARDAEKRQRTSEKDAAPNGTLLPSDQQDAPAPIDGGCSEQALLPSEQESASQIDKEVADVLRLLVERTESAPLSAGHLSPTLHAREEALQAIGSLRKTEWQDAPEQRRLRSTQATTTRLCR